MSNDRYYWQVKTGITNHWRIQKLTLKSRWMFIVLLDFAAEMDMEGAHCSPDGTQLSPNDFKKRAGFSLKQTKNALQELIDANLIEVNDDGVYSISNYADHQPKLTSSAIRQQRFRDRKKAKEGVTRNVTNNGHETKHVTERDAVEEKRAEEKRKDKEKSNGKLDFDASNPDHLTVKTIAETMTQTNEVYHQQPVNAIYGGKLTQAGKFILMRLRQVKKDGLPGIANIDPEQVEPFFIHLIEATAKGKGDYFFAKQGNLTAETVFRYKANWEKNLNAAVHTWKPKGIDEEIKLGF